MLHQENYSTLFSSEVIQFLRDLPYDVSRQELYSVNDLLDCYDPADPASLERCFDVRVYRHFCATVAADNPLDFWGQSCHDLSITNALNRMLRNYAPQKVVGIMGGHMLPRSNPFFKTIVTMSKELTERGFLVSSGGGPGAMEAVHLGAWLAERSSAEVEEALRMLAVANFYDDPQWLSSAFEVMRRFPRKTQKESLAIPTWIFGREPAICFATSAAKFFSNSVREETLLTTAFGGIILLPGSAGTFREIFQKIVQDHYLTWDCPSPMVFVGKEYWTKNAPIYPVLRDMLKTQNLKNLLVTLVDDVPAAIMQIEDFGNISPMIRQHLKK